MKLLTVIGIGNRLFCDDGIGNDVVEALSARNIDGIFNTIVGECDIAYCLSQIQSEYVVIIDAIQMGNEPGSIHVMPINEKVATVETAISMHNEHFLHLLQQCSPVAGFIIGIEPYVLSEGYGLSDSMKQNFDSIVDTCNKIIINLIKFLTA